MKKILLILFTVFLIVMLFANCSESDTELDELFETEVCDNCEGENLPPPPPGG